MNERKVQEVPSYILCVCAGKFVFLCTQVKIFMKFNNQDSGSGEIILYFYE